MVKEICDFCGKSKKLLNYGKARICSLCKLNQEKRNSKGYEVKSKEIYNLNSYQGIEKKERNQEYK